MAVGHTLGATDMSRLDIAADLIGAQMGPGLYLPHIPVRFDLAPVMNLDPKEIAQSECERQRAGRAVSLQGVTPGRLGTGRRFTPPLKH